MALFSKQRANQNAGEDGQQAADGLVHPFSQRSAEELMDHCALYIDEDAVQEYP